MALPTKEQFLANQISVIQDCGICQQNFDTSEHAPARLCGPDSCHHVFGASCLTKWLESDMPCANKCPMCRKELFVSENAEYVSDDESRVEADDEPVLDLGEEEALQARGDGMFHINISHHGDAHGERDADDGEHAMEIDSGNNAADLINAEIEHPEEEPDEWDEPVFCDGTCGNNWMDDSLGTIGHWPDAAAVIKRLWKNLYDICPSEGFWDDELEIKVHLALRHTDPSDHTGTIIWSDQWADVIKVAREMILQHFQNREFVELSKHDIQDWIESMTVAIGWQLCGDVGDCCYKEYRSVPCTGKYGDRW